ncbi:MAG: hypothetical protein EA355_07130 [Rhodobacteraceae bacterium]|nr:MAG: hypothetical protein EA355_07130 [Paracoccaceae bacterium]
MKDSASGSPSAVSDADHSARIAALVAFIDWAEREAADLDAPDCGVCLQLARMALSRRRDNA